MSKKKYPEPYFRSQRGTWCLQLGKDQVTLGRHPENLPAPKKGEAAPDEIMREYHRVMAERGQERQPAPAAQADGPEHPFVCEAYKKFLDWLQHRVDEGTKEQRTLDWYRGYIQDFVKFRVGDVAVGHLTVEQLAPAHVYQWVDSHPEWKTGKRGAMVAVQRPLNWAAKAGLLKTISSTNPLAGLEKPQQGRREQLVTDGEFRDILSVLTCGEALDLLVLSWETGMRPHELYTFEARFFDPANARIVFPVKLSKGKKRQRVVYLNDKALEIVRRRVPRFPEGPVMRNAEGRPWNMGSTNCLFQRVRVNLGRKRMVALGVVPPKVKRIAVADRGDKAKRAEHEAKVLARRKEVNRLAWKHGTKYSLYSMRHAYCTEALERGLDAVTVSVLMGHRDTTMISRVYSHLDKRHAHMSEAARRAKGA